MTKPCNCCSRKARKVYKPARFIVICAGHYRWARPWPLIFYCLCRFWFISRLPAALFSFFPAPGTVGRRANKSRVPEKPSFHDLKNSLSHFVENPGEYGFLLALFWLLLSEAIVPLRAADKLSWPPITSQNRPWVWWWWPGSAVDTTNIARQLQLFRDAGLGGVQVTPIYGVNGWESHYLPYLNPDWMRIMGFTVREAHRLGLGVDMTLGTGWCFGGPTVSDHDANASVVVKTFDLSPGERLNERFDRKTTQALVAFGPEGKIIDLTDSITTNGEVFFSPPGDGVETNIMLPKTWKIYAISQQPSGQKVKRAAPGGAGWMLNPFYPQAMSNWLGWFDQAFAGYNGPKPRAVFQDSYEYQSDWSPDFFAQFEKLRGYKLQMMLPALFGDETNDETARVKSDYRETVSDLLAEKTAPIWIDWAHRHRFTTIYQAHGSPANWLDLYADADVPETEMFHTDRNPLISKFASSAAHVAGRKLVAAETGTWLSEHFTVTLAELKYLADDMFISGVNHIYYHGCCYSPEEAAWPGWLFYASTEMNPHNSIWHDVPALNTYIARCQSVLQSGKPDNDILLYWPITDLWNNPHGRLPTMTVGDTRWFDGQPIGAAAKELWQRGYVFDYVSDRQLAAAKMTQGKIRVPGGDYWVVIVPACELMPVPTLTELIALAKAGATVIFESHLPADVPGWGHLAKRRARFKELLAEIKPAKTGDHLQEARLGSGRILVGDAEVALKLAGVAREPMTDHAGLFFVRRSFDEGWQYFIANRHGQALDGWVTLGRSAESVAIFDPMTGNAGMAAVRHLNGQTQVYLQLQPGASLILRAFAERKINGSAWTYWQTNGPATEITGVWNVKFIQGGPELPDSFQTAKLTSWTELGDTNTRRFAGTALYTIILDTPAPAGGSCFLNLGQVCQSARVRLNGKDYGTLITPPFGVVVDNLKPEDNRLEVEITNVSANRIRDLDRRHVRWKIFHDINFVNINYRPFDAANWPLTDSGLLGPVTLTPVAIADIATGSNQ